MLDKKQIQVIFLFKFKMSCKVAETTRNIINTSGPGAASKCSVAVIEEVGIHGTLLQFKKFCEGDKSPENEEHNCQPAEVDNNQLRAITEADPLKTTWESCQRFQCHPFYGHSAFEANWKGEKSSVSGCLMSWPKKKKKTKWSFWSVFSYSIATRKHFLIGLWYATKSGFYMTNSDFITYDINSMVGPRRSSNALPKAKLTPKEGHCYCLMVCYQSDSLQLSEPH